jgi:hypothetical protein
MKQLPKFVLALPKEITTYEDLGIKGSFAAVDDAIPCQCSECGKDLMMPPDCKGITPICLHCIATNHPDEFKKILLPTFEELRDNAKCPDVPKLHVTNDINRLPHGLGPRIKELGPLLNPNDNDSLNAALTGYIDQIHHLAGCRTHALACGMGATSHDWIQATIFASPLPAGATLSMMIGLLRCYLKGLPEGMAPDTLSVKSLARFLEASGNDITDHCEDKPGLPGSPD